MIDKLALVAVGGALGAGLRFLSVNWIARLTGDPAFGTFFVNVSGSFVMGIVAVLLLERGPDVVSRLAPFLMTGILGGFTTFSAFSLDAFRLYEDGRALAALAYVGASVLCSIFGLVGGFLAARWSLI